MFELSPSRVVLNPFTVFPAVTINSPQTTSFASERPVTVIDATTAYAAAKLEIVFQISDNAIIHRAKPAIPNVSTKWAHALASRFPELTSKSDAELDDIVRRMRKR